MHSKKMGLCDGCDDCLKPRDNCENCNRLIANDFDDGICNTGECGCITARSLCWKTWNDGKCTEVSIYDPKAKEYNGSSYDLEDEKYNQ